MGLGHKRTGTRWEWDTRGLVLSGTGTQRVSVGLGHEGTDTKLEWGILVLIPIKWDTSGLGHGRPIRLKTTRFSPKELGSLWNSWVSGKVGSLLFCSIMLTTTWPSFSDCQSNGNQVMKVVILYSRCLHSRNRLTSKWWEYCGLCS